MLPPEVMAARLDAARHALVAAGADVLLATPSSDLRYLIGYAAHPTERPTILAVPPGLQAFILAPRLEVPRLTESRALRIVPYGETENPYDVLAQTLSNVGPLSRIAISNQAWAVVLLRLLGVLPHVQFVPAGDILRQLRMVKSDAEWTLMAEAGARTDEVYASIVQAAFAGRTEKEVAQQLSELLAAKGLSPNWQIVASGPNSASPHHMTGDRVIEPGDSIVLDFGGELDGYQSDTTRTVHVGPAPDDFRDVYETVRRAEQAGVAAVRPHVAAQSVDAAARHVIRQAGYGTAFVHRTGHGIGLDVHEEPYIVEGNELELRPGMTFSVEPGVYLPGRFGVRIEDIVLVTDDGHRRLNEATRDLVIVS
ncbi:MAG TPA: Xaa-Pro peptidase family protein [Chloroflexota bacterium]|nr:Xaa-Pro peptidase family protein [Chloroflexota bacterium]